MGKMPAIVPVTDLRQDSASVLERVRKGKQRVIITQRGRAAAIMLSMEEFERAEHDRELLLLLLKGDREVARGNGRSIDSVLEEADRLLGE